MQYSASTSYNQRFPSVCSRQKIAKAINLFSLLDHLATEGCRTGRNRQTRKFTNRGTRETIYGVGTDLRHCGIVSTREAAANIVTHFQCQLPTIQDGPFEGIGLFLQVCLRTFTSSDEVLQNSRQQALSLLRGCVEIYGQSRSRKPYTILKDLTDRCSASG